MKALWQKLAPILFLLSETASSEIIRVAVASNFATTLKEIVSNFEKRENHQVIVSIGSTGKHYAQIIHGAPFDVFLSADAERPRLLEKSGIGVVGSRFTYALGTLVFWAPEGSAQFPHILEGSRAKLAIANPVTAPYGRAAQQALSSLGMFGKMKSRLVKGENINQAFHFVASGNASYGLVAKSQLVAQMGNYPIKIMEVSSKLYQPIIQQAYRLTSNKAAISFVKYLKSPESRSVIHRHGYKLP